MKHLKLFEVNRLFFECDQFEALSKLLDDKLSYFR